MRSSKKFSVLALVALAAGLSLTACNPDDSDASGASSSSSASPSSNGAGQEGSSGSGSSGGSGTGGSSDSSDSSGSTSASGTTCRTANLTISAHHGISGEGQMVVDMVNSGSTTCTMHGFPGVDLQGAGDSGTVSAHRSTSDTPDVRLAPGEKTDFTLYYPMNDSGGSGFTFTKMIVTPPNETQSKTLTTSINVPADNPDQGSKSPGITVNAVGAGK